MTAAPLLAVLVFQSVWVVDDDGGPGVNFTDLPPAIAAAADGDVLLVRNGNYSTFSLTGKGLRILGEGPSTDVGPPPGLLQTTISNVPAGSLVYVERMRFLHDPEVGSTTLGIDGASTTAVLANVEVFGGAWPFGCGLSVSGARVQIHRSILRGANNGFPSGANPGDALRVTASGVGAAVHVATSSLLGGSGSFYASSSLPFPFAPSGRSGAVMGGAPPGLSSSLWIADATVTGGNGGFTANFAYPQGNGGPGIQLTGGLVRVSGALGSLVRGGNPGCGGFGVPGGPGPGISQTGGLSIVHSVLVQGGTSCSGAPGTATSGSGITLGATPLPVLRVSGLLTPAGSATITLTGGPPNAPFFLAMAGSPDFQSAEPLFLGEILIDPGSWFPLFSGNLSANGAFVVTLPLAGIAPTFFYVPVFLQGITLDPSGTFWRVSNATVATIRP